MLFREFHECGNFSNPSTRSCSSCTRNDADRSWRPTSLQQFLPCGFSASRKGLKRLRHKEECSPPEEARIEVSFTNNASPCNSQTRMKLLAIVSALFFLLITIDCVYTERFCGPETGDGESWNHDNSIINFIHIPYITVHRGYFIINRKFYLNANPIFLRFWRFWY